MPESEVFEGKMELKSLNIHNLLTLTLSFLALLNVGCSDDERFTSQSVTQVIVQDFQPDHLDILWVLNDQSPMRSIRDKLVGDAKAFFERLDNAANNYQMGITTADMQFNKGALKPASKPLVLTRNFGTLSERSTLFGNLISQTINLSTGAEDHGFEAALTALQSGLKPRANIPLVLIFISSADDRSVVDSSLGKSAIEYYSEEFLKLKNGKKDLLRVYSVNLTKDDPTCLAFNSTNPDILKSDFEDRYFTLTDHLGGDTANICAAWASNVDLTGIKLQELPKSFEIDGGASASTLRVSITQNGNPIQIPYSLNDDGKTLLFQTAPPEGSVIILTYQKRYSN